MKKTALALLFLSFFVSLAGKAQLRTALAGGVQLASVPGNSSSQWDTLNYNYSSRTGFHVGLLAEVPFFNSASLYFRTGMLYTNKGRKFSASFDTASGISKVSGRQFVNYMEVPLNLIYKIRLGGKTKLMIGGGPYASFLFTGRETKNTHFTNGTVDNSENTSLKVPRSQGKYMNIDYGVNGLLGLEVGRVFMTANYSRGMSEFYQTNNQTGSFKHQVMGGTLGVFLSRESEREHKKRDRDKDGVADVDDDCPREKGTELTKGCPDKDADGVADINDKCSDIAGSLKRRGCPAPDTDKDGVNDDDDKCPSEVGIQENSGCPEIDKDLKSKIESYARRVQFRYKSAVLIPKSKAVLNGIVKLLKENPGLNVFIEGYTSSDGNPHNHLRLSQARAESVKEYLQLNGIKAKRLKAIGFGNANPLNKNKTDAERAVNRRVELKITNY